MTEPVDSDILPEVYPIMNNPGMNMEQYEAVLNKLDVECRQNYLFLSKNLYPVDAFYAHRFFTKRNFRDLSSYGDILDRDPELPLHHTIAAFHLFLLTNY